MDPDHGPLGASDPVSFDQDTWVELGSPPSATRDTTPCQAEPLESSESLYADSESKPGSRSMILSRPLNAATWLKSAEAFLAALMTTCSCCKTRSVDDSEYESPLSSLSIV